MNAALNDGAVTITMDLQQARFLCAVLGGLTPSEVMAACADRGIRSDMRTQPGQDMASLFIKVLGMIEVADAESLSATRKDNT